MNSKRCGAAVLAILTLLVGTEAAAQTDARFGSRDQLTFSAERLFGFERVTQTDSIPNGTATTTTTGVSAFGNLGAFFSAYAIPRVAVDGFVARGLSVGASLGAYAQSRSTLAGSDVTSEAERGVMVGPRVGYAVVLGRFASLWPRLGLNYVYMTSEGSSNGAGTVGLRNIRTQLALVVDAPLVVTLTPHFFVSLAPTVDVGVGGKLRRTGSAANAIPPTSQDVNESDFGVQFALGGYI